MSTCARSYLRGHSLCTRTVSYCVESEGISNCHVVLPSVSAVFCFFFSSRRRHTRYWRDWSSDVCLPISMGLALGIDYSLFIVSRLREERHHGASTRQAILTVAETATRAVVFSGIAFVLAMLGMFLMQIGRASCRERV